MGAGDEGVDRPVDVRLRLPADDADNPRLRQAAGEDPAQICRLRQVAVEDRHVRGLRLGGGTDDELDAGIGGGQGADLPIAIGRVGHDHVGLRGEAGGDRRRHRGDTGEVVLPGVADLAGPLLHLHRRVDHHVPRLFQRRRVEGDDDRHFRIGGQRPSDGRACQRGDERREAEQPAAIGKGGATDRSGESHAFIS